MAALWVSNNSLIWQSEYLPPFLTEKESLSNREVEIGSGIELICAPSPSFYPQTLILLETLQL